MIRVLRRAFGLDLAGRIAYWKRRYKGDFRIFDFRRLNLVVSGAHDFGFRVSATASCNDHSVTEGSTDVLRLYTINQKFQTLFEAQAHVEEEVRRAESRHPDSTFYQLLFLAPDLPGAHAISEPLIHVRKLGAWLPSGLDSHRTCPACGGTTSRPICESCGEIIHS